MRRHVFVALTAAVLLIPLTGRVMAAAPGEAELVSTSTPPAKAIFSTSSSLSADGSTVVFESDGANLSPADGDGIIDLFAKDVASGELTLLSMTTAGEKGNGRSMQPSLSADGRLVAFISEASNLVAADPDSRADIYVKDLQTGSIVLVSASSTGVKANRASDTPQISADGTTVAFMSEADNLDPADTDNDADIYVKDLVSGQVRLASSTDAGAAGNGPNTVPTMSGDGTLVAFESRASDLDPGDSDADADIYLKDLATGDLRLVSTNSLGVKANQQTLSPDLSTDGSRIAFNSNGSNMDPADADELPDVYVKEIASGALTLASVTAAGVKGDRSAQWPSLSSDGMIVAFETHALNLDPRDAGASVSSDIYVKDLSSGSLSLATTSDAGDKGDGESFAPDLSQNGQRVSFISIATGLDPLDPDTLWDVYVKDLVTDDITLASISGPLRKAGGLSDHAAISPDGAAIAFDSTAANLDPRDSDALVDVYVKQLSSGRTLLVSMSWDGHKANGNSALPTLSSGGQVVAFASNATNLDPADTDAVGDIFVREPVAHNTLQLMSTSSTGQKGNGASDRPSLSADGLSVAFHSTATNLHPDDGDASSDVFVKDRRNGEVRLASASTAGVKGIGDSLDPSLSGDGTKVAFESEAQMDPADTDALRDVYVKDLVSGELVLASTSTAGVKGTAHSMSASISGDGTAVAFFTLAQLDPADTDAFYDVYVKDLVTGATLLASRTAAGADITGESKAPRLSADGDRVSFSSNAPDLHPGDADAFYDVFVKDLVTAEVTLASIGAGGKGNDNSVEPRLAGDGMAVVFVSDATNLDPLDLDPSSDIYLTRIQSSVPDLSIDTSRPAASSVARYGRFEKEFTLSRAFALDKVHDPAIIDVTATFRAPSGASYTVPAFFGTDLTLRPETGIGGTELYDPVPGTESGVWHARFSPDEIGAWQYTLHAQDKRPGLTATEVSAEMTFSVTASSAKGQVERDPRDDRFLRYGDGTPYYPMGQNVAFGDGNPFNDGSHYYEPHFQSMQAAGQNWTRVWMTDFYITAIEWNATHWSGQYAGVGRYSDVPAFRVEQTLELAEQYGLEVQLVLNDHGQFSSHVNPRWYDNPYNAANGGPVPEDDPAAFFSNPTAKQLFKQRLRYLVARYGAYRDILAWELFNETQFIGRADKNPFGSQQVRDDLVAWHAEMAAYLRSLDPYDHLITTSSDIDTSAADIWADPNIDLVQVHDYGALSSRDERFSGYAEDLNATYDKPVIIGEFGLPGDPAPEPGFDPTTSGLAPDRIAHLVQGTAIHNSAWASAMSGSGAMSWWWGNYIRNDASQHRDAPTFPLNERINPPLRDFFAGEDLAGMALETSTISAPASVVALGLDNGSDGFAWIRDAQNEYGSGVDPGDQAGRDISGVTIDLVGFAAGAYRIEIHDPWGVAPLDDSRVAMASGGTLSVALPTFNRDIAIKIRPAGAASTDRPITATVTSPDPGAITITESATTDPPPPGSGFSFLGHQLEITAPSASSADPLTLVFTIDASLLASVDPDLTADTVTVFRDGDPTQPCTTSSSDDPATPDPCVSLRQTLSAGADAGDARITVLSSAASHWNFGTVPDEVPDPPTNVTAIKGNAQATVGWTPPVDDGGSEITVYTVTSSPGGVTASAAGSATGAVVTGLTNGTTYTFTVTATNGIGTSASSAPSNAVTPAAPQPQTISFPKPPNSTLAQSPLAVPATASSGLTVTLTSDTPTVCSPSGLSIDLSAVGTCTIVANQAGNADFLPAPPVTRSFGVTKANQTITFPRPPNSTMLASPLTISATASSGLPVTVSSSTTAVCTASASSVTFVGTGTCTLVASQSGTAVYNAATPITRSFTVSKAGQTITFPRPSNATLIQSPVTVTATASSGLPVTVTSSTQGVCTVSGVSVTLHTAGTCTLQATQTGDALYAAAPAVTRSFTVSKAPQTITLPNPGSRSLASGPLVLSPSASSGLPVTLASQSTNVCTVSGNTVSLLRTGTCRIRATQPGNATYAAAPAVTIQFAVTP